MPVQRDYQRLGDYITSRRIERGMDRKVLAEDASITTRTLADIEGGKLGSRKDFSSETMEAICLSLGWKPGSWRRILEGHDPEPVVETVGDPDHDAQYVASPGERVETGKADDEVLREIRAMRADVKELSERVGHLEQRGT